MEIKSCVKLRRQRNVELGGKLWFPESLKWTFCTNFLLRPRSKRGMQSQMWNLFTQHGKLTCWRSTETQVGPQWKCFEAYSTEIKALSLLIAHAFFCAHSLWVKLICFLSDSLIVYKNSDSSLHQLANYSAIHFPPTYQIQANQEVGHTLDRLPVC